MNPGRERFMKSHKTIVNVLDESSLTENDYRLYSSFLESQLSDFNSETNAPWFIKVIAFFGAWFGSLLFLGFLALINILNSGESMIFLGGIFTSFGTALSYSNKENHLFESLSLSLSILGQILLAAGIGTNAEDFKTVCYVGIIIELLIYLFAQSYTHKFLSVILIPFCMLGIIWNSPVFEATNLLIGGLAVATVLLWIYELPLQIRFKNHPYFYIPTAYGTVLGLLLILILSINNKFFEVNIYHWYITTLFSFFSLIFLLYKSLYQDLRISKRLFLLIIAGIALIFSPTIQAPGIITSVLVVTLGFSKSNRMLLTIGIVFLATFLISFYYSLQQTLLVKSLILISTGILFLGIYIVFTILKKRVSILWK
jgi:hypothetical protein